MGIVEEYEFTQITQDSVSEFETADKSMKESFEEFGEKHSDELRDLETIIDKRNDQLVATKRALRDEAIKADAAPKTITIKDFSVVRKSTTTFKPELLAYLTESGLLDKVITEGAAKKTITFDAGKLLKFATSSGNKELVDKVAACMVVEPMTPAVYGPKPYVLFSERD